MSLCVFSCLYPHQCLAVFCLSLVYISLFSRYCDMWFTGTVPSELPAQLVSQCLDFSLFSDHFIHFVSKCGSWMTETVVYWRCDASGSCSAVCAATPPSALQTRDPSCADDSHLPLFCIQTLQSLLLQISEYGQVCHGCLNLVMLYWHHSILQVFLS